MSQQSRTFVEHAAQSLRSGHDHEALEFAEQAIVLDPNDAEGHILRGIALAKLLRTVEATEAFQQAVRLDPLSAKAHHNLAVHLYIQGERAQAALAAREAVRLEPNNVGSMDLLKQMGLDDASASKEQYIRSYATVEPPPQRPGYSLPVHSIAWIERLGKRWSAIGWAVVILGALGFVMRLTSTADILQAFLNDPGSFEQLPSRITDYANPVSVAGVVLVYLSIVLGWIWAVMDIMDRRGNWAWVAPLALCCCCEAQWLALAVYLALGRKSG